MENAVVEKHKEWETQQSTVLMKATRVEVNGMVTDAMSVELAQTALWLILLINYYYI
jgi:hypothetical protein